VGRVIPIIALIAVAVAVAVAGWLHWRTPAEHRTPATSSDYDDGVATSPAS
jgi:hypothetical protein